MNKIVLFTANTQGGIIQFTIQLYQVLKKKGFHVIVFKMCIRDRAITEKTKAVVAVDLGGVICDYDKLYQAIESKKNLFTPRNDIPYTRATASSHEGTTRPAEALREALRPWRSQTTPPRAARPRSSRSTSALWPRKIGRAHV